MNPTELAIREAKKNERKSIIIIAMEGLEHGETLEDFVKKLKDIDASDD